VVEEAHVASSTASKSTYMHLELRFSAGEGQARYLLSNLHRKNMKI